MTNELDEAERNLRQAVSRLANCKPHDNALAWSAAVEAIGTYAAIAEVVRKRLETVEGLWHEEQQEHTATVTRAEQAERERDEAREYEDASRKHTRFVETEWAKRFDEVDAARERAEADNAALTTRLQAVCDAAMKTDWMGRNGEREARFPWDEIEFALRDLHADHPSAALLERMRALEDVLGKFREVEWQRTDWQGFCPFRRHKDIVCPGSDGVQSGMGTPKPTPHSKYCPYHALAVLKPETK